MQYGNVRVQSGELFLNGHDHARDMVKAVDFIRSSLEKYYDDLEDNRVLIKFLTEEREEFEAEYDDPEYFGYGTITSIIDDLKALDKKAEKEKIIKKMLCLFSAVFLVGLLYLI